MSKDPVYALIVKIAGQAPFEYDRSAVPGWLEVQEVRAKREYPGAEITRRIVKK